MELQSGEKILYQGHPSWRAIVGYYLTGILVTIAAAGITKVAGGDGEAVIVLVAGIGLTILSGFIKRVATTYTITDRRLNIKRGIIARKVQETRLERVQNVNYRQSVYERLMQVGTVDFDTAAGDDYGFAFAGVSEPEEVVEKVDRATGVTAGDVGGTPETRN